MGRHLVGGKLSGLGRKLRRKQLSALSEASAAALASAFFCKLVVIRANNCGRNILELGYLYGAIKEGSG